MKCCVCGKGMDDGVAGMRPIDPKGTHDRRWACTVCVGTGDLPKDIVEMCNRIDPLFSIDNLTAADLLGLDKEQLAQLSDEQIRKIADGSDEVCDACELSDDRGVHCYGGEPIFCIDSGKCGDAMETFIEKLREE